VFAVLAEQKAVGHAGNVIANREVTRFGAGGFFVGFGHGAGSFEIEDEKLFETADGTVAVFGDGWRFVNMREEEALETGVSLLGIIAKAGETLWSAADVLDGRDGGVLHADARRENKIAGEEVHGTTNGLIEFQFFASGGMFGVDSRVEVVEKRDLGAQSVEIEQFRLSGVVEVGGVVGNFVHPIDELRFERRAEVEKVLGEMRDFSGGVIARMLDNAFPDLEGEIQAGEIEIRAFELLDDAQRLKIVIERRAAGAHQLVQHFFSGMAEGRMADVVSEGENFGKLGIETESGGDGAGDLRNFERVRQAIAEVIGVANGEDLGFGFEAAESAGVDDAVAIAGKFAAIGMRRFGIAAAA